MYLFFRSSINIIVISSARLRHLDFNTRDREVKETDMRAIIEILNVFKEQTYDAHMQLAGFSVVLRANLIVTANVSTEPTAYVRETLL